MTALIDRLRQTERDDDARAKDEYTRLVKDTFDGVECDPAETIELLRRVGKTVDELESDCAFLEERHSRIPIAARLEPLIAEQTELRRQIEVENEKVTEAIRRRDAACEPIRRRLAEAEQEENAAQNARNWLHTNLPAPLKAELDRLIRRRGPLSQEQNELRRALSADYHDSLVSKLRSAELAQERYLNKAKKGRPLGESAPIEAIDANVAAGPGGGSFIDALTGDGVTLEPIGESTNHEKALAHRATQLQAQLNAAKARWEVVCKELDKIEAEIHRVLAAGCAA